MELVLSQHRWSPPKELRCSRICLVKPNLTLLAENSNPTTLEGSVESLQNLTSGNWKFAAYIQASVQKENGLPILIEFLRMDNNSYLFCDHHFENMELAICNSEVIGEYAMQNLVNRLPEHTGQGDHGSHLLFCKSSPAKTKSAKALANSGNMQNLVNITKGRGDRSSKAAAQVLNMLWQYQDLRSIY